LLGCTPEVTIGATDLAALAASYHVGIEDVIRPLQECSASVTLERNFNHEAGSRNLCYQSEANPATFRESVGL
jgi:hypothetical protein